MTHTTLFAVLCASALAAGGCKKERGDGEGAKVGEKVEEPAPERERETDQEDEQAAPELYDEPVERRLYSDRIESSSFLWTNWNRFQENYHPNYILDGDPKTAWVEGAGSSGAGEWVRVHLSSVEGVTKVRVRVQSGYHKSKSLFEKNARLKKVKLRALPGKQSVIHTLEDSMRWQEIELAFDRPQDRVEALELEALSVYEGAKYTDLCVSDLEIYVTGKTVENPAFEKGKLESLLGWKKERLKAARLLSSAEAKELPVLAGYRVVDMGPAAKEPAKEGPNQGLRSRLSALRRAAGDGLEEAAARAREALEVDFSGWVPVRLVAKEEIEVPPVDGLDSDFGPMMYGLRRDAFFLPPSDHGVLLRSAHLSAFDAQEGDPRKGDCTTESTRFMRPPRGPDEGPLLRELLLVSCVREETRDGEYVHRRWQLLEFDGDGNLVLAAGPDEVVQSFSWEERKGRHVLTGGLRVFDAGRPIQRLVSAQVAAKD